MTDLSYPRSHSAGGVVVNREGEVIVVLQEDDTWSLPKGHLRGEESPLAAARREIFEESGVSDLDMVRELGSYTRLAERNGELEHKTITIYLFTTSEVDLRPRDAANPEAHWVPAESVVDLLSNSIDRQFFVAVLPRVMEQACFHEY